MRRAGERRQVKSVEDDHHRGGVVAWIQVGVVGAQRNGGILDALSRLSVPGKCLSRNAAVCLERRSGAVTFSILGD